MAFKKTLITTLSTLMIAGTVFSSGVCAQTSSQAPSNSTTLSPTSYSTTMNSLTLTNHSDTAENSSETVISNSLEEGKAENDLVQDILNNIHLQIEDFTIKAEINNQLINTFVDQKTGETYLYLPSQIDASNIQLKYTGNVSSVSSGTLDTGNKKVTFDANHTNAIDFILFDNTTKRVNVIVSNLPCVQIDLKDGLTLDTVKDNPKDIKYKDNTVSITDPTGENALDPTGGVEFKGRGNDTWKYRMKKPYQIKFEKKTSVLGMQKAKKWVLLANMNDAALMRNSIVFDMARGAGELAPDSRFVDLFVNGNYEGNYTLTEKVDANRCGVDFQTDQGVLVEMDNNYWQEEEHYFEDSLSNAHFTLKDSQADDANIENSVALKAFNQFEEKERIISDIINGSKDWQALNQHLDTDSLIYYYLMQELTENIDSAQSSMFLYRDGENDKIHFGPLWDYDNSMGNMVDQADGAWLTRESRKSERINWFIELRKIPEFNKRVGEIYREKFASSLDGQIQAIDGKQGSLTLSADMNYHRYVILGNPDIRDSGIWTLYPSTYADSVQEVKNWLLQRKAYLDQQFTGVHVGYNAYTAGLGWQDNKIDGEEAGTTGQSRQMEAIGVYLNSDVPGSIEARSYVDDMGWLDWKTNGAFTGTTGQSKGLHAVEFKLSGDVAEHYDIFYRTHVTNIGWMGWTKNGKPAGTIGFGLPIEAVQVMIVPKDGEAPSDTTEVSAFQMKSLEYSGHVQNIGWMDAVADGEICGTTNKSLRMEAFRLKLANTDYEGSVQYQSHIQNNGWEKDWKSNGALSGTQGSALRLEAVRIRLTGEIAEHYDICYRVHAQNFGWLNWARNGQPAGTEGYGYRLESMQIILIEKGESIPDLAPKSLQKDFYSRNNDPGFYVPNGSLDQLVEYTTHVQNIGWQPYTTSGMMAGTSGQSLRLEGLRVKLSDSKYTGSVLYRTHIQNIGWETSYRSGGAISGTTGRSLRLEAVQIKLTGEMATHYDIYYRVHAQNFGWLGWTKNGASAGTAGYAFRLEGIQIVLVEKGQDFYTLNPNISKESAFYIK